VFPDYLIIDFDSTFINGESLDELANFVLRNHPERTKRLDKIKSLTEAGMTGEIPFDVSLSKRMTLLDAHRNDVQIVTRHLTKKVTLSFKKNRSFLQNYTSQIVIISGGFKEMIIPIISEYGINENQVFANEFVYDANENIIGINSENVMALSGGKCLQANALKLSGEIHAIGDGFTDYQLKVDGPATKFYAFTENVKRKNVCSLADGVLTCFDDYIHTILD
jgi:D-3-phosphoglycerate dehydrogenase